MRRCGRCSKMGMAQAPEQWMCYRPVLGVKNQVKLAYNAYMASVSSYCFYINVRLSR